MPHGGHTGARAYQQLPRLSGQWQEDTAPRDESVLSEEASPIFSLPATPHHVAQRPIANPALKDLLSPHPFHCPWSPIRFMAHHGDASKKNLAPTWGFMVGSPWPSIILYIPQSHPLMSWVKAKAMLGDDVAVDSGLGSQPCDWLPGWGLVFLFQVQSEKHFFEDWRTEEKQNVRNMHRKFPLSPFTNK